MVASAGIGYSAEKQSDITFESSNPEDEPTAFASSYFGFILNQNQPWSYFSFKKLIAGFHVSQIKP
ncbi:MAG: hypothetical protein WCO71_08690, partial [Pseudomonadota bacterium]